MREIKFRCMNKFLKCMVYSNDCEYGLEQFFSDIDGPVMQFSGLQDSKGDDIYEGDIIKYGNDIGFVQYGKWISHDVYDCGETEILGFYADMNCKRPDGSTYIFNNGISEIAEGEVIGNIHQNPELLEEP